MRCFLESSRRRSSFVRVLKILRNYLPLHHVGPDELPSQNFRRAPQGLGPDGSQVRYYNFDVQPVDAAPIYALFREGEDSPVEGQLNIVGVIPGDSGYSVASAEDANILAVGIATVNCPIVEVE